MKRGTAPTGNRPIVTADAQPTYILNLKPVADSDGTVLETAGVPTSYSCTGWTPLTLDGDNLIVNNGRLLGVLDINATDSAPTVICTLPSVPRTAFVCGDELIVSTPSGIWLIDRHVNDGTTTYSSLGRPGVLPPFAFVAADGGLVSTDIDECTTTAVGDKCLEAYTTLARQACDYGAFLQPVMVRCRMYDSKNRLMGITPPVAVMGNGGSPLSSPWTFDVKSRQDGVTILDGRTVTANPYFLVFKVTDIPTDGWARRVALAEIQVSPQFHPVSYNGTARVAVDRASVNGQPLHARVILAGSASGLSASSPTAAASNLKAVAAHADGLFTTIAVIRNPFAASKEAVIMNPGVYDPDDEIAELRKGLRKKIANVSAVDARLSHGFTLCPGLTAVGAGRLALADLSITRRPAPSPMTWAISVGDRRWTARVRIDYANGDVIVTDHEGSGQPLALSPFISIEEPDAVRMTISMKVDGEESGRSLTLPLVPDTSGRFSVYTAASPLPLDISGEYIELDLGDQQITPLELPGTIAVTNLYNPLAVKASLDVGAQITALSPARTAGGSWDFGRGRFCTFTDRGIHMVCTSTDSSRLSASLADSHSVGSRACVADAGDCIYALADGGVLLRLSGARPEVICTGLNGLSCLGWSLKDHEILLADLDDNECMHILVRQKNTRYWTPLVFSGGWLSLGGRVFCSTAGSILNLSDTVKTDDTQIHWTARIMPRDSARRHYGCVRWPMKASRFNGTVTLNRAWLADAVTQPAAMARLKIDGCIKSPINLPVYGHDAIDLVLDIQATVSPDFHLGQ